MRSPSQCPATSRPVASAGPLAHENFVSDTTRRTEMQTAWFPGRAAPPQVTVQTQSHVSAALNEQALIDRLVQYLQFWPAGEQHCEVIADLLRTPILSKPLFDDCRKLAVIEPARFGATCSDLRPFLRGMRSVRASRRVRVSAQLATDRRRCPTQIPSDLPDACSAHAQIRHSQPFIQPEEASGRRDFRDRYSSAGSLDPAVSLSAVDDIRDSPQ